MCYWNKMKSEEKKKNICKWIALCGVDINIIKSFEVNGYVSDDENKKLKSLFFFLQKEEEKCWQF